MTLLPRRVVRNTPLSRPYGEFVIVDRWWEWLGHKWFWRDAVLPRSEPPRARPAHSEETQP